MGRLKLRLFDAMDGPLEPGILRYGILEAGLRTSLGEAQDQSGRGSGPDPGPDPGPRSRPVSQVLDPRYLRS